MPSNTGASFIGVIPAGSSSIGSLLSGGTEGSVIFLGAGGIFAQDNANFFYDDATNQLRITGDGGLRLYNASGSFFTSLVELRSQGYANSSYIQVGDGGNASMSIFSGTSNTGYFRIGNQQTSSLPFEFFTGTAPTQHLRVTAQNAASVPAVFKLAASQTGNAQEVRDSADALLQQLDAKGYLTDAGMSRVSGDVTNITTTMGNITGLSANLTASAHYTGRLVVFCEDSIAADGIKFDFDGGAATMTSFRAHGTLFDAALLLSTQTTALATDFVQATITGTSMFECYFALTCNAAGTFIPRFAQNAHTTGTATAFRNSYMTINRVL